MKYRCWWAGWLFVFLSACGGGDAPAPHRSPSKSQATAAAAAPAPTPAQLMDWAELAYPQLFPPSGKSGGESPPFTFRHYPATQNYLGVADGHVYVLGPVSGGQLMPVGAIGGFTCLVLPMQCGASAVAGRYMPFMVSSFDLPAVSVLPSERNPAVDGVVTADPYWSPRGYAFGDLTGDGCAELVMAPSFPVNKPEQPIRILRGDCRGGFADATASLLPGGVPLTGAATSLAIADFNGDGRGDVMISAHGVEDVNCGVQVSCLGGRVTLLLSSGGVLVDASDALPHNGLQFNHNASVGDVNGDGHLDIAAARLGGGNFGFGIWLALGDGRGNFSDGAALLPHEIRFWPHGAALPEGLDAFGAGAVELADLDGDGKAELIAANYVDPSKPRQARIYGMQGGALALRRTMQAPAAAGEWHGASDIAAGDIDGDGRRDVVVLWEGPGSTLQVLRNEGDGGFADVSTAVLQDVQVVFDSPPPREHIRLGPSRIEIEHVASAARGDIVAYMAYQSVMVHQQRSNVLTLAGSRLAYRGAFAATSVAEVVAYTGFTGSGPQEEWPWEPFQVMYPDLNGDGRRDIVLLDATSGGLHAGSSATPKRLRLYGALSRSP